MFRIEELKKELRENGLLTCDGVQCLLDEVAAKESSKSVFLKDWRRVQSQTPNHTGNRYPASVVKLEVLVGVLKI